MGFWYILTKFLMKFLQNNIDQIWLFSGRQMNLQQLDKPKSDYFWERQKEGSGFFCFVYRSHIYDSKKEENHDFARIAWDGLDKLWKDTKEHFFYILVRFSHAV